MLILHVIIKPMKYPNRHITLKYSDNVNLYITTITTILMFLMLCVMQETVDNMSLSTLRQLLLAILQHYPGIIFDALEATESQAPAPTPDHPAPAPAPDHPATASPHWCICGRCSEMATDLENLCCGLHNCISQRPVSI